MTIEDVLLQRDWFVETQLGVKFYDYQTKVSNAIITALLLRNGEEIPIEISRQSGKTEAVVGTVAFLLTFALSLTKRFWGYSQPLRIVIWAPQKEQAKTDFDRLKTYLKRLSREKDWGSIVDNAESNQTTLQIKNGSFCYIFPLTPLSNPESKTADLQIFEEAHKILDMEKKNKAEPMGASTNSPEISIGVSWYVRNYFKRLIDSKKGNYLRIPAPEVIKQRRDRYNEDGDPRHLLYERKYNKIVERDGTDDPAIQTQWLLNWVLGGGQFMVAEDWNRLAAPYEYFDAKGQKHYQQVQLVDEDLVNDCFVGIDTAKHPDSTVVTVIRWNAQTNANELIALLELHGENYSDQFGIISGYDTVLGKKTGMGLFDAFKVVGVAIDATGGSGDFMPDMFAKHTKFRNEQSGLFPVKFSMSSKDVMYTNLLQVIKNTLTALPNDATLELERMYKQLMDLEKEYKGQFMSCHHPKDDSGQEYHDDYPDSWALAEYAFAMRQRIAKPKIRSIG